MIQEKTYTQQFMRIFIIDIKVKIYLSIKLPDDKVYSRQVFFGSFLHVLYQYN